MATTTRFVVAAVVLGLVVVMVLLMNSGIQIMMPMQSTIVPAAVSVGAVCLNSLVDF